MDLHEHLDRAEGLTSALGAALAAGNEPACAELLAARGDALAALAAAATADPAGRVRLQSRLQALVEADRVLQAAARDALAEADVAFHTGIAMGNRPRPSQEADALPTAVDRLA
jgi:DNA-binding FadR family transcriptional regulator